MHFQMHIRQRFLVFLMLVSIGPLALVSRFFLEDTGARLNERIESSLITGGHVSEEIIHSIDLTPTGQNSRTSSQGIHARTVYEKITRLFPDLYIRVFVK